MAAAWFRSCGNPRPTPGWQGPVGLTAPGAAPSAAPIAAFAQSSEQVDVAFVDRNGVVQVIWVTADDPHWQGPVGLTPPGTAPSGPRSRRAAVRPVGSTCTSLTSEG